MEWNGEWNQWINSESDRFQKIILSSIVRLVENRLADQTKIEIK